MVNLNHKGMFKLAFDAPSVRVMKTAAQTITTSTVTLLSWDEETWDNNDQHDNVTNNSRLIATFDGKYLISSYIFWNSSTTATRRVWIKKNAAGNTHGIFYSHSPNIQFGAGTLIAMIDLKKDDYVYMECWQDTGADLDVRKFESYFSMSRVSA